MERKHKKKEDELSYLDKKDDHKGKDKKDFTKKLAPKKDFKANKFQKTGNKSSKKTEEETKENTPLTEEQIKEQSKSQIRRQKSKISELKKKLMTNYTKLIMKKSDIGHENKVDLVNECTALIDHKYEDLIFKHDGCRIVQQMIKHGSKDQKDKIVGEIKPYVLKMIQSKYSNHLLQKAFYYAPQAHKTYFRKQINSQISKLIMNVTGSDVIEYIYCQTDNDKDRHQMVQSFYGQYYLLLKSVD
jgi:hypothetical protein